MSNLIRDANGESMLSLTGDRHIPYAQVLRNAQQMKHIQVDDVQKNMASQFTDAIKNTLATHHNINLKVTAETFKAANLSSHIDETVDKLMAAGERYLKEPDQQNHVQLNQAADALAAIKTHAEEKLAPAIEADFRMQQENAMNQPKPTFKNDFK